MDKNSKAFAEGTIIWYVSFHHIYLLILSFSIVQYILSYPNLFYLNAPFLTPKIFKSICMTWFCYQYKATSSSTAMLLHLREFAAEKRADNVKQPTIYAFFN